MTPLELELIGALETHSVDEIREILDSGLDARIRIDGKSTVNWLTEMYFRSDRFPECLRLLLDHGAMLDDPLLEHVLQNDGPALSAALRADSALLVHQTSMVSCFTPLLGASLLHVAAEFGHEAAARVLIDYGADVNANAAVNEFGLNGHTPLFHVVNSHDNRSLPILQLLLEAGARCDVLVPGIIWGEGFEWETTFFDVTPVSYCHFGLLPQVHRRETDIVENIRLMLSESGRPVPPMGNIPNRYLQPRPR